MKWSFDFTPSNYAKVTFRKVFVLCPCFSSLFFIQRMGGVGRKRKNPEFFREIKKSELCLMLDNGLKYLSSRLPQQAAIPKMIYKKSSKESSAKGSFPDAL